ncbi:MAG TPA: hypothetical protein VEO19_02460 [Terriglobia bacterium]|nr:hypothetical protein [Terriglobia bacterium]
MCYPRLTICVTAMLVSSIGSFAADDSITLLAGRELHVQFITELSSKSNETGDMWTGKVVEPVFGKGGEIVPEGSTVEGHVTFVKSAEPAKGKHKEKDQGEMMLVAESISLADGTKYNIAGTPQPPQDPQAKVQGLGPLTVPARNFSKKGKTVVIAAGTEVTFAVSHDTNATKVPVRQ